MAEIPEIVVTGNKSKNVGISVLGDLNKINIPEEIHFQAELPEVVVTGTKPKTIGVSVLGDLNKIEVPTEIKIKGADKLNDALYGKNNTNSAKPSSDQQNTLETLVSRSEQESSSNSSIGGSDVSDEEKLKKQEQEAEKQSTTPAPGDGMGTNPTDPKVLHDGGIDKPGIARGYEPQNKHLNENGEIGTIEHSHSIKVDGISYPLIQINNQVIENWQIVEFKLRSEGFVPELSLTIKDEGRFEEKNGATQANNEIKVIIIPKSQKVYRPIQLKFIINSVDYGDIYTTYYTKFKFLQFNETYTKMIYFPGCSSCPQPPNHILNTWELCHQIAMETGLGFAATKMTKEIEDRVERYMLTENYWNFLEKHNEFPGLDEDSVMDFWVDFYGYINLINLPWVFSQNIKPEDLSIYADMGFQSKTNETIDVKPTKTNRIITNFHLMAMNNNLKIKDYETNINNVGFNYGSRDKLFSYKFEDHEDAKDFDSNKMDPQDLEIVQKTVDGSHTEEYVTANLAELIVEPDKWLHNRQKLIKQKYFERMKQKTMKIKMDIPNFGLCKGILVYVVICETDPINKQRILTSEGNVEGETGNEKMAKMSLPKGMTTRDLIQNESVSLLNEYLSGFYYIDGVEYTYSTDNPIGEIEQTLLVYKREQANGYSNKHTEVRVDYDAFKDPDEEMETLIDSLEDAASTGASTKTVSAIVKPVSENENNFTNNAAQAKNDKVNARIHAMLNGGMVTIRRGNKKTVKIST